MAYMKDLKETAVEVRNNDDDMRLVKFEMLIEDIDEALYSYVTMLGVSDLYPMATKDINKRKTSPLEMVFERGELNDYGRIIIDKANIICVAPGEPWAEKYGSESMDDVKIKIAAAKDFVKLCKDSINGAGIEFIFWCLMVLGVDDTNADEKLSLVCDFARMLKVTDIDDILMDIAYIVKCVYNEADENYAFKTEIIPDFFGKVIGLHGN